MADLHLGPPTPADVGRELAKPVPAGVQRDLAAILVEQLRDHEAAISEILEAARGLPVRYLGSPPGVRDLDTALKFLNGAVVSLEAEARRGG